MKRYKTVLLKEANEKEFYTMKNVGKSKYLVNFHDGKKTNNDGSPFYDIKIFKNRKDMESFIGELVKKGYKLGKSPIYK